MGNSNKKLRLPLANTPINRKIEKYISTIKEKITQEALLELATTQVFAVLSSEPTLYVAEKIALPIYLKSMTLRIGGDKENPLLLKINNDERERITNSLAEIIKDAGEQGK